MPVKLEPGALQSRVKHSNIMPLRSLILNVQCSKDITWFPTLIEVFAKIEENLQNKKTLCVSYYVHFFNSLAHRDAF